MGEGTVHEQRGAPDIAFWFDGRAYAGYAGDTLAAALWRAGIRSLRNSPGLGEARGMWCGVGHCYECRVVVDGVWGVRACLLPIREGLAATRETVDGGAQG